MIYLPWPSFAQSASFVGTDVLTHGSWKGVYGAQGVQVSQVAANYPTYAQVSLSGQSDRIWVDPAADLGSLQKAGASTDRIASCWYAASSFTVDVNLTDGQSHQIGVYCYDWDSTGRSEKIDILNASNGAVLNSQTLSSFSTGKYLFWNLSGHVQIRVTGLAGPNALLNGIFFDPVGAYSPPGSNTVSVSYIGTDASTQGSWKGVYGRQGNHIIQDTSSYPYYAQVNAFNTGATTWAAATNAGQALQKTASSTDRIAACWYSVTYATTSFTLDVNLTDGQKHNRVLVQ